MFQELACRVQVYQVDQRVGRANVVRAHDDVALGARGQATPLHHDGNQRSGHDGTGKESKKSKRLCNVKPEAPEMHSCGGHQGWCGTCPMKAALAADLSCGHCCSTVHDERHLNPT